MQYYSVIRYIQICYFLIRLNTRTINSIFHKGARKKAIKDFNKFGWFFDNERREMNESIVA